MSWAKQSMTKFVRGTLNPYALVTLNPVTGVSTYDKMSPWLSYRIIVCYVLGKKVRGTILPWTLNHYAPTVNI